MQYRYLSNVTTLELDGSKCTGCGRCAEVCPHEVLAVENRAARAARPDYCIECGACMRNCPHGALQVHAGVGCAAALLGNGTCGPECGKDARCCS